MRPASENPKKDVRNTTHGRDYAKTPGIPPTAVGGSFKSRLQTNGARVVPRIPPAAVGGSFRSSLQTKAARCFPNPTHGSGWIVQVQPTKRRRLGPFFESHPREWMDRSSPAYKTKAARPLL